MPCILHLSDLHFGTEQTPVMQAIQQLSHQLQPDLLILSGDITQRAQPQEFAAARRFVDSLHIGQQLIIAGNHDIPLFEPLLRLFTPYQRFQQSFGAVEPVISTSQLLAIGVKTTRRYLHTDGLVSSQQIARVSQLLRAASPEQLKLIVTHQPIAVIRAEDETNLLKGREAAIAHWSQAGADLILGGHIHLPYSCAIHQQYSLARPLWGIQAGTAISSRTRFEAGHSVNLLYHQYRQSCRLERWDYQLKQQCFECVSRQNLNFVSI